jgi:hypothetical protein
METLKPDRNGSYGSIKDGTVLDYCEPYRPPRPVTGIALSL